MHEAGAAPPALPRAGGTDGSVPPLPYEVQQPAPSRAFGVFSGIVAVLIVVATLGVIGRAVLKLDAASAPANADATAGLTSFGADPLASAGVGVSPKPVEVFDRATAALRAAQAQCAEPLSDWAASGGMDLRSVRSSQDLDRRLELLELLARATRDARMAGEGVMQQLRAELPTAGTNAVQRELWVAQWATEVRLSDDQQAALAREKHLAAGREMLRTLRQAWGRWYLDRSTGRVTFDDAGLEERFTRQAAHAAATGRELDEVLAGAASRAGTTAGTNARAGAAE